MVLADSLAGSVISNGLLCTIYIQQRTIELSLLREGLYIHTNINDYFRQLLPTTTGSADIPTVRLHKLQRHSTEKSSLWSAT
jgi:hypothetical protein